MLNNQRNLVKIFIVHIENRFNFDAMRDKQTTLSKNKNDMKSLTKKQIETYTILVRLGDSKELALKTVLKQQQNESTELYELAYNS